MPDGIPLLSGANRLAQRSGLGTLGFLRNGRASWGTRRSASHIKESLLELVGRNSRNGLVSNIDKLGGQVGLVHDRQDCAASQEDQTTISR